MYIIFRRVLGVKVKSSVKMMKPIVGGGQVAKYFVDIHGTFSCDNNLSLKKDLCTSGYQSLGDHVNEFLKCSVINTGKHR